MKGKVGTAMGENDEIHEKIGFSVARDNSLGIHIGNAPFGVRTAGTLPR